MISLLKDSYEIIFKIIGNILAIFGMYSLFSNAYKSRKLKMYYEQKLKELEEPSLDFEYVINMSGHPMKLFEDHWIENKKIIDVHTGNIQNLMEMEEVAERILAEIDPKVLKEISYGKPVIFAFPGMSSLSQIMMVKIHAISGRFPIVTLAVHSQEGWVWRRPMDLQITRTNTRTNRWERYKNSLEETVVKEGE